MSFCLVGSEMCIRDSTHTTPHTHHAHTCTTYTPTPSHTPQTPPTLTPHTHKHTTHTPHTHTHRTHTLHQHTPIPHTHHTRTPHTHTLHAHTLTKSHTRPSLYTSTTQALVLTLDQNKPQANQGEKKLIVKWQMFILPTLIFISDFPAVGWRRWYLETSTMCRMVLAGYLGCRKPLTRASTDLLSSLQTPEEDLWWISSLPFQYYVHLFQLKRVQYGWKYPVVDLLCPKETGK